MTFGSLAGYVGGVMGMGTAGYMAAFGAPELLQVASSGTAGGISSGATHRALTGQDTTPEAVAMDGMYGSLSALTFYGTRNGTLEVENLWITKACWQV